ncbi:MAG: twitching motility protein PilT, partial [Candidatus Cloacimonetes bacterium]|nr:twitching motility protein PilT [Candidatus Cloacimonadota bacterium]
MALSFINELQSSVPEYAQGASRIKQINKVISDISRKKESYLHIKKLLKNMVQKDASDMDFGGPRTKQKVWYRVYGDKAPDPEMPSYTNDEAAAMVLCILSDDQKNMLLKNKNLDFALSVKVDETETPFRFRGNIFFERNSLAVNFRLIKQKLFKMDELQIPDPIVKRLDLRHEKSGLFLVTGITGSGKSATLDTII